MLKIRTSKYNLPDELTNRKGVLTHFLGKDTYVAKIDGKSAVLKKDQFYVIPTWSSDFGKLVK